MIRVAAIAALLAGCLDEPGPPGGPGTPPVSAGLHHAAVVADVDNDGLDEVILWGHDANGTPMLFVYAGGGPPRTVDLTIAAADADTGGEHVQWVEPLAVSVGEHGDVYVLTRHDALAPNADGNGGRYLYVQRFDRALGSSVHTSHPPDRSAGSYVDDRGSSIFVFEHVYDTGGGNATELLLGDGNSVFRIPASFATDESTSELDDTYTYEQPIGPTYEQGLFAIPNNNNVPQYLLDITSDAAFGSIAKFTTSIEVGPPHEFRTRGSDHMVRATNRFNGIDTVSTDQGDQYLTIASVTDNQAPEVTYLLTSTMDTSKLLDVACANLDGNDDTGLLDVVALEDGVLRIYKNIARVADGDATAATKLDSPPLPAGYDLLAIGNFRSNPLREIEVFARHDLSLPPLCYVLDSGGVLGACP